MADDRNEQQRDGFHWPPTSEEMESIQVIEVRRDAPPARRRRWPWMVDGPIIAQAGLAFASLASIGIAVTSLLAPAQPTRAAKHDTAPAPVIASSTVPAATTPGPAQASGTTFQHKVSYDSPPALAELRAQRAPRAAADASAAEDAGAATDSRDAAGSRAAAGSRDAKDSRVAKNSRAAGNDGRAGRRNARAGASHRADGSARGASAQMAALRQPLNESSTHKPRATARAARTSLVARHAPSRETETQSTVPRREAGSDPVSRVATKTGVSVWKAMRAVGRSFMHDRDGSD